MKQRGLLIFSITFIYLSFLSIVSAQSNIKGENYETSCLNNICTTTVYSYEKYFFKNNQWEEIEDNFFDCSSDSEVKYCTKNYYFNVKIKNGTITAIKDNQNLTFKLTKFANSNPTFNQPIIQDNLLKYQNIVENVDLQYYYFPKKLKEEIMIKQNLNLQDNLIVEFSKI